MTSSLLRAIALAGVAASGALLLLLAVLGTTDVVWTYLFNRPIPAATEFAAAILPATITLALAWSQRQRAHIDVDIVVAKLSSSWQNLSEVLSILAGLAFFLLLLYGAVELALESWSISETAVAAVQFPVWPMKAAFAAGAAIGALECLRQLADFIRGARTQRNPSAGERL